jgi:hypothetical protein
MSIFEGLTVLGIGAAMSAGGLAAWTGAWNFWATPRVPGYGVLPLLLLPAGLMCFSIGVIALFEDLADNPLVALALLPLLAGFFGGALITIPGFFVFLFWTPKRVPDRTRPRWLPPTWTPPENSFSTLSRPFLRRELRELRPPAPYWPARLVVETGASTSTQHRYGFLARRNAALTWFDCTWDTPECKESFSLSGDESMEIEVSKRPPYRFLDAPIVLSITTPSCRFCLDVFTGIFGPTARTAASLRVMKR